MEKTRKEIIPLLSEGVDEHTIFIFLDYRFIMTNPEIVSNTITPWEELRKEIVQFEALFEGASSRSILMNGKRFSPRSKHPRLQKVQIALKQQSVDVKRRETFLTLLQSIRRIITKNLVDPLPEATSSYDSQAELCGSVFTTLLT